MYQLMHNMCVSSNANCTIYLKKFGYSLTEQFAKYYNDSLCDHLQKMQIRIAYLSRLGILLFLMTGFTKGDFVIQQCLHIYECSTSNSIVYIVILYTMTIFYSGITLFFTIFLVSL